MSDPHARPTAGRVSHSAALDQALSALRASIEEHVENLTILAPGNTERVQPSPVWSEAAELEEKYWVLDDRHRLDERKLQW